MLRIVERKYRKAGDNGRPKMPAERMLRIYFLQQWFNLLHGEEKEVYADSAYANAAHKQEFEAQGVKWKVSRKGSSGHPLSDRDKEWNRKQSRVRAFGEHPFQVFKSLWHYTKVRYRGLFKNTCQLRFSPRFLFRNPFSLSLCPHQHLQAQAPTRNFLVLRYLPLQYFSDLPTCR